MSGRWSGRSPPGSNWEEVQPCKAHRVVGDENAPPWPQLRRRELEVHREGPSKLWTGGLSWPGPWLSVVVSLLEVVSVSDEGVAQRVKSPANWPSRPRFRLPRAQVSATRLHGLPQVTSPLHIVGGAFVFLVFSNAVMAENRF